MDRRKIETISTVRRPESCEDVESFIQAAQFNVRFYFDNKEGMTYEEATAPLRELLKKGAKFEWDERRQKLLWHPKHDKCRNHSQTLKSWGWNNFGIIYQVASSHHGGTSSHWFHYTTTPAGRHLQG